MNLIDERDKMTIFRKLRKKEYDSVMTLSADSGNYVRLLDEGMVTWGDGSPRFYIVKGVLKKFYDNLDDNYVGSINIGHTDFETFPERIVGQWTKSDLRLVDLDDGRQALDVRLNVNTEHPLIKALQMAPFDVGVSVEMYRHDNEMMTNNPDLNPFNVPIVDEIDIRDFAIVGNAGNVNSMGIHLKGDSVKVEDLAKLLASDTPTESLEDLTKLLDGLKDTEPEAEPEAEPEGEPEAEHEAEPEAEPEADPAEEQNAEEEKTPEEESEAEPEVEEDNTGLELSSSWKEVLDEIVKLRDENASLKAQLAAKNKVEQDTLNAFKKLKVSLGNKPKEAPKTHDVQYTDGIGD